MFSALSWEVTRAQVTPPATIMRTPGKIVSKPMSLTDRLVVVVVRDMLMFFSQTLT